jgi:hypothetical protein
MAPYGLGRVQSPDDSRDHTLAAHAPTVAAAAPPPSYAPHYLWTVLDQGQTPRCVGYSGALGRQIESMLEAREALVFDADDLYASCKQLDGSPNSDGTFIRVACKVLQSQGGLIKQVLPGLTPEQARALALAQSQSKSIQLPSPGLVLNAILSFIDWVEGTHRHNPTPAPTPPGPAPAVKPGDRLKISAYARLRTLTEVKQAIAAYGDAWIGSPWANSWFTPGPDGTLPPADELAGGHAYKFVGYDDSHGAFLMQNSWGTGWGLLGHAWMPYSYVTLGDILQWESWQTFS